MGLRAGQRRGCVPAGCPVETGSGGGEFVFLKVMETGTRFTVWELVNGDPPARTTG